jgi:hypothetical protein
MGYRILRGFIPGNAATPFPRLSAHQKKNAPQQPGAFFPNIKPGNPKFNFQSAARVREASPLPG